MSRTMTVAAKTASPTGAVPTAKEGGRSVLGWVLHNVVWIWLKIGRAHV